MIWDVLKIEETKDKRAITKAYRDLLSSVNPEEKPEEFKLLRSAYEEALKLAEKEDEPDAEEKSAIALWLERVDKVYGNLGTRRNPECWNELLNDPVCLQLDSRPEAEEALLRYFYGHYRIPHEIWLLLDRAFDFLERQEELLAAHPEGFVRYVILDGITEEDGVPYSLFPSEADGESVDAYLAAYYEAARTDFGKAGPIFEKLAALPLSHPYGDALRCRYDFFLGDRSAEGRLEQLQNAYPEEIPVGNELLLLYHYSEEHEKAEKLSRSLLERRPQNQQARRILAYALAGQKKFKPAVEQINRLMAMAEGNQRRIYELDEIRREWNHTLIESYRRRLDEDGADEEAAFELAWCCLQNDCIEEAEKLLPLLGEGYPSMAKYVRLRCLLYFAVNEEEKALEESERFMKLTEADQDEEDRRKRAEHVTDLLLRKCGLLMNRGCQKEGIAALEEAVAVMPENADTHTKACQIYLQLENYPKAKAYAEEIIRLAPGSYHGYLLLALASYRSKEDNLAFSSINKALELDGSDLYAYQLKLMILTRNDAFDAADALIEFLQENGITDDPVAEWCRARMAERRDGDRAKAWELYEKLERRLSQDEDKPDWIGEFYFRMALLRADIKDAEEDYSREDLLALLEKGLDGDPGHYDCLEYKGWLLKRDERNEEALAVFQELEKRPRGNLYVEKQLAELYYESLFTDADRAMAYYEKVAEQEDGSRVYHLNAAYLSLVMKNYSDCEKHLRRALEISPEDPWIYFRFAQSYIVQRRFTEALAAAGKAVEIEKTKPERERRSRVYWTTLAQVYRLLKQPEAAVEIYRDCRKACSSYPGFYRDVFETYLSSSLWEQARVFLAEWRKESKGFGEWSGCKAIYHMAAGEKMRRDYTLFDYKAVMGSEDYALVKAVAEAQRKNFAGLVTYREAMLKKAEKNQSENLCHEYAGLALALWYYGKPEAAKECAEKGLEAGIRYDSCYDLAVPVTMGSRALCRALLGQHHEALLDLKRMREAPLCSHCRYGECKDLYCYEAEVELIAGNRSRVQELIRQGLQVDPSEESLLICEAYLNKEGMRE